jgi:hypothetical protein
LNVDKIEKVLQMLEKIVKWFCIGVLVMVGATRAEGGTRILLQLVVCSGAAFAMMQGISDTVRLPVVVPGISSLSGESPRMSLVTITDLPARGESL